MGARFSLGDPRHQALPDFDRLQNSNPLCEKSLQFGGGLADDLVQTAVPGLALRLSSNLRSSWLF
jgi:hypothetical protein